MQADPGSSSIPKKFIKSAEDDRIIVLHAPIDSPSAMSRVERLYTPLRLAYKKTKDCLSEVETDDDCLQLSVATITGPISPEGRFLTFSVSAATPPPARRAIGSIYFERAKALQADMNVSQRG